MHPACQYNMHDVCQYNMHDVCQVTQDEFVMYLLEKKARHSPL